MSGTSVALAALLLVSLALGSMGITLGVLGLVRDESPEVCIELPITVLFEQPVYAEGERVVCGRGLWISGDLFPNADATPRPLKFYKPEKYSEVQE